MNIWEKGVITFKGLALQAKLIAGNTLEITKVEIGSGYVDPETLRDQTAVTDTKKTLTEVASITYPEEGKCAIKIKITNEDVETEYTAKQVGFYANDPDDGEILYFIAQASKGTGTTVPPYSEMYGYTAEWTFYFQYGQADNVTVVVDPSNSISYDDMVGYIENNVVMNKDKGKPNGVPSLDETGKVPATQLPPMDYVPNSEKGVADGVATLASDAKVPLTQLAGNVVLYKERPLQILDLTEIFSMVYADNMFVLAHAGGLAVAKNGFNFEKAAIEGIASVYSVTYGNGRFVCVDTDSNAYYSTDGITWEKGSFASTISNIWRVCYGSGRFVAVSENDEDNICYSDDGMTWKLAVPPEEKPEAGYALTALCYGNGKFVAVDGKNGMALYSADGATWESVVVAEGIERLYGVAYGSDVFVAVTQSKSGKAYYSADGTSWTETAIPAHAYFSVTYCKDLFIATDADAGYIVTSKDGVSWQEVSSGIDSLFSAGYGNDLYLVAGGDGRYAYSTDGITWTSTEGYLETVDGREIKGLNEAINNSVSSEKDGKKLTEWWVYLKENYDYTCDMPADTSTKPYSYTETVKDGETVKGKLVTTMNADDTYTEVYTIGETTRTRTWSKTNNQWKGVWS